MAENRLSDIDFIKGIMILLMVMFHITYQGSLKEEMTNITKFVYAFHMPVFLFYSGFFVSTSKPFAQRMNTLFRTIIIPYILFETIYILCLYFAGKLGFNFSNKIDHLDFISILNTLFVSPIGAYWYLHTLVIGLIVIYIVDLKFYKDATSCIIIIGLLYFMTSLLVDGFKFENSLFMLLGYYFKRFKFDIHKSLFAILAIAIIAYISLPDLKRASVASLGITFLMISFLKSVYNYTSGTYITKWFSYLGRNTLIIVLIHPIFLNAFKIVNPLFLKVDITGISFLIVTSISVVLCSVAVSYVLDKIKASKIIFGRDIYIPL